MKTGPKIRSLEERFWLKVKKTKQCWWWVGGKRGGKYGGILLHANPPVGAYAHRASWIIHFGAIPKGLCVLHKCDNPLCVNPEHLFIGTQKDNMKDTASKGRRAVQRGEQCSNVKLSVVDVLEISKQHASGVKSKKIAMCFSIRPDTVQGIVARRSWGHV